MYLCRLMILINGMKPTIPKGTRDFAPQEMERRQYIFSTVKEVFRLFGFQQIETPAMENLSTLMGKYGEEGDKLLFKILNSGDWLSPLNQQPADQLTIGKATTCVSEKGLRYDLTVPFARFVVQHRDEIQFPFKRYQIQPVWRADRPQKGRYREFYQCDVDVVGTNALTSELELLQIVQEVYRRLSISVDIHINDRKILAGIAQTIGATDKIIDITVAIDKLEKIGLDNVNSELSEKGLSADAIRQLQPILNLSGTNTEKLDTLSHILDNSEVGLQGVEEMRTLFRLIEQNKVATPDCTVQLNLCLARGLNYYTGAIFEVKARNVQIGSITGGGRYDNLTGIFGMSDLSGVGISFGADRIYDVLNQLNLYPDNLTQTTQILFACFGEQEQCYALQWANQLRRHDIPTEVYPDIVKIKKQMNYADQKHIPFVAIVGDNEIQNNTVMLKDMRSGEQQPCSQADLLTILSKQQPK